MSWGTISSSHLSATKRSTLLVSMKEASEQGRERGKDASLRLPCGRSDAHWGRLAAIWPVWPPI
jgi:hypothetical protein